MTKILWHTDPAGLEETVLIFTKFDPRLIPSNGCEDTGSIQNLQFSDSKRGGILLEFVYPYL